jgi:LacI family transcriptional regulator
MSPGGRGTVTLRDVARAADVHVSTASRALDPSKSWRISQQTVAQVESAAEKLGYTPDMIAKGLKRGTTTMIGVIVADLENPFIGPIIRGILHQLEKKQFVTLVAETLEDHDRFERTLNHLASRRVNGVITTAARTDDRHMLARFAERSPALVLAVRNVSGSGLPYVAHDDSHGAELAANHLSELGHSVTAQLRGPREIETFGNRSEGFRRAIGSRGLVDVSISEAASEVTLDEGRRLMKLTLDQNADNPPTAIFAQADVMAIGAIDEMRARGLTCPEDISVIGYDDAPLVSHVNPPLSTIELPGEEIGNTAGKMVMQLIEDPDTPPGSVDVPAKLIPRESTAAPREAKRLSRRIRQRR